MFEQNIRLQCFDNTQIAVTDICLLKCFQIDLIESV